MEPSAGLSACPQKRPSFRPSFRYYPPTGRTVSYQITEKWDGRDRWKRYTYERTSCARSAQIDPDRVLLLDVNYTNNSKTLAPQAGRAATKWSLKWLVWLQDALLTWAFFA